MNKNNKDAQIHIRLTKKEKDKVVNVAKNYGYDNISKFIMDNLIYEKKVLKTNEREVFTITLSPTLDYFINIDHETIFKNDITKFNETEIHFSAGGRGINTSKILNEFQVKNTSVYVAGGFTGSKIYKILEDYGINQYMISNDEETRININLVGEQDIKSLEQRTSRLTQYTKEQLINFVEERVKDKDIVLFSGSYVNEDKEFVLNLLKNIKNITSNIFINSSTKDIENIVKEIKPKFVLVEDSNHNKLKTKKKIKEYMNSLIEQGAEEAAFFLDANYTYYFTKDEAYISETKLDHVFSTVGLGDAFLGGIISNFDKEIKEKIAWGAAAQKAKSLSQSKTRFSRILDLYDEVKIIEG